MRRFSALFVLCGALVGILAPSGVAAAQSAPTSAPSCDAVAHHEDASHSGSSCTILPANPTQQWSITLNGSSSYPVIADGKVFVTTSSGSNSYGGWLYAIDQTTGAIAWGPLPLGGTYYWSSLTYDNGTLFVNGFDGLVTAYNASNGSQLWSQSTGYFSGELVAHGGVVYLQSGSNVYALSEATGAIVWFSSVDGDGSSLSVDDTGVYVAAGCSWYRLSLSTGAVLWSGNNGCSGGGGGTTYLAGGRVFARPNFGDGLVLNEATGALVGSYSGIPAFSAADGYFASGNSIFAETVSTLTPLFTTTLPAATTTSPVLAGNVVYVGAGANVYGVDGSSGQIVWTGALPAASGGGAQYSSPVSDIAVGDGLLVVPAGNTLTAFGGPPAPTPTTTNLTTSAGAGTYGSALSLVAEIQPTDGGGTVSFTRGTTTLPGCGAVPVQAVGSAYLAICTVSTLPLGASTVTATYSGDTKYASSSGQLIEQIGPAPLTVTASSPTTYYGQPIPAVTPSYSGFVNGESASNLTTQPNCYAQNTGLNPSVGTYTTVCSGASDPNYTINYVNGTLTINKASTTTTASATTVRLAGTSETVTFSARLTSYPAGAAISGALISFSIGSGTQVKACSATTNSQGVASCAVRYALLAKVPSSYTASFAGTTNWYPSRGSATVKPLFRL